jgi:hypothetical protein
MTNTYPVGIRVRVAPFDSAPPYLPISGTISRRITALNNITNWFVLTPDEPFDFQQKIPPGPYTFRRIECPNILIRSRWEGHEIGDKEETSVFILIAPDQSLLEHEPINPKDFIFDAWGMCSKEE